MAYWDTFNHATHKAIFDSGRIEEAEAYRKSFLNKDENECCWEKEDCGECPKKDVLEDLNKQYTEKFGKKLVGKRAKDAEWIIKKLDQ